MNVWIGAAVVIFLAVIFLWLFFTTKTHLKEIEDKLSSLAEEKLPGVTDNLTRSIQRVEQRLDDFKAQAGSTFETLANLTKEFGDFRARTSQWEETLRKVRSIFGDTTRRGQVGEFLLERILAGTLPSHMWARQYRFADGLKCDAVVYLYTSLEEKLLLPIDSKVSVATARALMQETDPNKKKNLWKKFTREIKDRAREITRYIKPGITTDYALMFVPSEEVLSLITSPLAWDGKTENLLLSELHNMRVVPVGPSTIYSILAIVLAQHQTVALERKINEALDNIKKSLTLQYEAIESAKKIMNGIRREAGKLGDVASSLEESVDSLQKVISIEEDEETEEKETASHLPESQEDEKDVEPHLFSGEEDLPI